MSVTFCNTTEVFVNLQTRSDAMDFREVLTIVDELTPSISTHQRTAFRHKDSPTRKPGITSPTRLHDIQMQGLAVLSRFSVTRLCKDISQETMETASGGQLRWSAKQRQQSPFSSTLATEPITESPQECLSTHVRCSELTTTAIAAADTAR